MSHLNILFDRYAAIGTVMHYILVIIVKSYCSGEPKKSKQADDDDPNRQ